ncbi:Ig-like domain-containing protein [Patescibacteria group bacterium]|nr:Ig-like domain-containing protein [Patescibacteria group bacterium]
MDDESGFSSPRFEDTGWTGAGTFGCAGGGTCSYTSTGLTSGTTYYSRVRARGTCTQSAWSATVSVFEACASGSISASPNPCTIAFGETTCTSTISWSSSNATSVSVEIDLTSTLATGASGSQAASFIDVAGYTFYLRGTPIGTSTEVTLDSVFVDGEFPPCPVTGPSSPSASVTSTSAELSWTPGSSGSFQILRLDTSQSAVDTGCPGGCLIDEDLPLGQSSYSTGSILTPGQRYYWNVVEFLASSCQEGFTTGTEAFFTEVVINLTPSSLSVPPGDTATLTADITSAVSVDRVEFVSADTGIATVSPATDSTGPLYQTTVTGVSTGVTTVTATVYLSGSSSANGSDSSTITVEFSPWWQTADADVITTGNLQSLIPSSCTLPTCNPVFSISGTGGYPGVPVYGGTTFNFDSGTTSSTNWLANSAYIQRRLYDYSYFRGQVPADITLNSVTSATVDGSFFESGGTTDASGYTWYLYDGAALGGVLRIDSNMTLSGGRRVILFVGNADLELGGRINLTDKGADFFMAIVDQSTQVLPAVTNPGGPALEGLYLTDTTFSTGSGTEQLHLRGFVTAHSGFNLERDLGSANDVTPAELFEGAPELIFTYPRALTLRRILWREVAP